MTVPNLFLVTAIFILIQKFIRSEDHRAGRGSVAAPSVGAQFSAQLAQLRSRIDATAPHYIRCLKPNDELLPDEFDPKQIVEQLRYSGVLEAVRVSRAGYPTRYPHDVFVSRYYILGGRKSGENDTSEGEEVKQLVEKIAYDIWEADRKNIGVESGEDSDLVTVSYLCLRYKTV